jgi:DNA-binding NarL/FixJ family response regulator
VRCLIVEDEPPVARTQARVLKGFGAIPNVVGTTAEALAAVTRRRWDLLIVDLMLPDGSGETVVRAAKRLRPRPAVVVASGALDSASRIRLQLEGALVADKGEFSSHLLGLSLEALRRARSVKRCATRRARNDRAGNMNETKQNCVPGALRANEPPSPFVCQSSTRDALAEFGAIFRFSPKEQQVLVMSLDGLTDKDIAARLGITHGTVRTNWVRMARKIGTRGGEREVLKHFARWCAGRRV